MRVDKKWLIAAGLIASAVIWRVVNWHYAIAPNLEIVTASTLVAAVFLGWRMGLVVPLVTMAISDVFIHNTPILFFTWSAFALIGLAGLVLRRWREAPGKLVLGALAGGAAGSVFFFLYTNFGVWLIDQMYPHTWAGLAQSYVMGVPFYRTMLLGNLVLVPAYFAVALYGPALVRRALGARVTVTT
jgi:hypothetical protein